ncbi:glycosyltransferase [Sporosarcina sp. ITBMC105]
MFLMNALRNIESPIRYLEDENTFKVIYTGSIRLANNVETIVNAAQKIKELGNEKIKFLIYGEGPDRAILEEKCKENNINNVIFKGQIHKKYIPYVLSRGNLNILHYKQSNTWKYGGSQNKLAEYIASGKPILSTIDMNYNLISQYNCGITTKDASPERLAEGVLYFHDMTKDKYESYCENTLNAANDLDYKTLTMKLENILLQDK